MCHPILPAVHERGAVQFEFGGRKAICFHEIVLKQEAGNSTGGNGDDRERLVQHLSVSSVLSCSKYAPLTRRPDRAKRCSGAHVRIVIS